MIAEFAECGFCTSRTKWNCKYNDCFDAGFQNLSPIFGQQTNRQLNPNIHAFGWANMSNLRQTKQCWKCQRSTVFTLWEISAYQVGFCYCCYFNIKTLPQQSPVKSKFLAPFSPRVNGQIDLHLVPRLQQH